MEIRFFTKKTEKFIKNLEKPAFAKTLRILDLLEKFGNKLGMPYSKKINKNLFELRVRGGKEVRIIYCFRKNTIIILHAFIKKTRRIPKQDIVLSRKRFNSID